MYTVNGKQYREDSVINQRIKKRLVSDSVKACVSDLIEEIKEADYDHYVDFLDEFENMTFDACPECFEPVRSINLNDEDEAAEFLEYLNDNSNIRITEDELEYWADDYRICECCGKFIYIDAVDRGFPEIYEYWIVDDLLGDDLLAEGEPVLKRWGGNIWGRCGTGQAIAMDGVIGRICMKHGWLEGQENSWEHLVS